MSDEQVAPAADPAEQAMVELEQRQGDSAFMAKYLNGDKAALATMTALHERAYPGAPGAPGEAAPGIAPAAQTAFSDALGSRSSDPMDVAREAAFAPARGPWEFEGLLKPGQSAEETARAMQVAQELHVSGLPPSIANVLRGLGERNVKQGIVGDHEKIEAGVPAAKAELEKRHGADAAQIIKDFSRAFALIDERAPLIATLLWEAGIDSTPEGVEALANWHRATRGGA